MRPTYLPSPELERVRLSTRRSAVSQWYRVHPKDKDAIYYGRSPNNRFSPLDVGVLYAGADVETVLFEVFGDEMFGDEHRIRSYRWFHYGLSRLTVRSARLCNLGSQKVRAQLNVDLGSLLGPDVTVARKWAAAIHSHPSKPDGIIYRSRMTAKSCLALFERVGAERSVEAELIGSLSELEEASEFLDKFDCKLV